MLKRFLRNHKGGVLDELQESIKSRIIPQKKKKLKMSHSLMVGEYFWLVFIILIKKFSKLKYTNSLASIFGE